MTYKKLANLFEAFANYYWSVPVEYVIDKVTRWHPDVTAEQVVRALRRCSEDGFEHHCCVITEGLDEPELVVEHLYAVGDDDLDRFLAARIDGPFCDCDEQGLLNAERLRLDISEVNAVIDFGRTELGLGDEWVRQLVHDCYFQQPTALYENDSWVIRVLQMESYGKIHFRTVEQVKSFRELGNRLYQVLPNPVLKGWKPSELDHPPVLLDDIPEKDEDIPDHRPAMEAAMEEVYAKYGGREKVNELLKQRLFKDRPMRKIGPNDPCPCGSGKKYKKCCGR